MKRETLDALQAARRDKCAVALLTELGGTAEVLFVDSRIAPADFEGSDALLEAVRDALRQDRSREVEDGGQRWFVRVFSPPLRLFIVGGVPHRAVAGRHGARNRLRDHADRPQRRVGEHGTLSGGRDRPALAG